MCLRRNISCWQYLISWTTFGNIYFYTQHTSRQFKYLCDIMIGLTCSWAWSIGLTRSPPPLCVLTSLIAEGRRGAEAVSFSFFPSILFLLSSLDPFLSHSASFHWWPTCQQLLLWQAVNALHVTEWYTVFCFFFTMKASLPVQWAL